MNTGWAKSLTVIAVLALAGCGSEWVDGTDGFGGKADSPFGVEGLVEGSPMAFGVLAFVNDADTNFALLDDDVGLDKRAAENIVDHRDGGGAVTNPFDDVAELDDVSRVGPSALTKIAEYAYDHGFILGEDDVIGNFDGVDFTVIEASRTLRFVNTSTVSELDDGVRLDSRAATAIARARPIVSVEVLADVSFVGWSALAKIRDYVGAPEIAIVSDLDKTVIPPVVDITQDLPDAPYPGVGLLYRILESGRGRLVGDMHYVTARPDYMVVDVPDWLAQHNIPAGPIETGISPIGYIAEAEKIRDATRAFELRPNRSFVMFGDTNHRDPDAYRAIIDKFPDRVLRAFMHNVKAIDASRLEGLFVFDSYAEVAGELLHLGLLGEYEARLVMEECLAAGEITAAQLEQLVAENR